MAPLPETDDMDVLEAREWARGVIGAMVDVLDRHGLLSSHTVQDIEQARTEVSGHRVFADLLPDRFCNYDNECIHQAGDYVELVRELAGITGGEWVPEDLTSVLSDHHDGCNDRTATISFRHRGETVCWDLDYDGRWWISALFPPHLIAFAAANLVGDFVPLPVDDQCQDMVYLPRAAAAEITQILAPCDGFWPNVWR